MTMLPDPIRLAARIRRDSRGATAVEYAIVLTALLLFCLGTMDVGRLMWDEITLDRAVQAAARCAVVNSTTCGATGAVQTYAASQTYGMTVSSSIFTVSSCAGGGTQVQATLAFHWVTPFIGPNPLTLVATACQPPAT
jgi:Flp pilus assembly protein TadG